MPRRGRGSDDGQETEELNLVPFMNMVVVLIPMLLLSVVFLKVGTINITSPELSTGPEKTKPKKKKEKKLNLTVAVGEEGLRIGTTDGILPPKGDCPKKGPTLCLRKEIDVEQKVKQARAKFKEGTDPAKQEGQKLLEEVESAYDWMRLYNQLRELKEGFPDETVVKLSASPGIPYNLLVRTMDVARYKLPEKEYKNREKFWNAEPKTKQTDKGKKPEQLFNDPVLTIAK